MTTSVQSARPARRPRAAPSRPARQSPTHLFDHLRVVRAHWLAALLVFLVVFGLVVTKALRSTPVYEAASTIQIDNQRGASAGAGLMSDMLALDRPAQTEAEIAVLLSYRVATKAAESAGSEFTAIMEEVNAYRPYEVLRRALKGGWTPCRLTVETDAPSGKDVVASLVWVFDSTGGGATVYAGYEPSGKGQRVEKIDFADPYVDSNRNGRFCEPEPYETGADTNGNGVIDAPEPFIDENGNRTWDPAEPFEDKDGDEVYDYGEPYQDLNENGNWDPEEWYTDINRDGMYDKGEEFVDLDHDGFWAPGERYTDVDRDGCRSKGTPIPLDALDGHPVRLVRHGGSPAGRTYRLTLRSAEAAAAFLRGRVSAEEVGEWTGIVRLSAQASSPYVAQTAANAVVNAYLDLKQDKKQEKADKLLHWLNQRIRRIRSHLRDSEKARDAYIMQAGAVMLSERASGIYEQQTALIRERFDQEQVRKHLQAGLDGLKPDRSVDELLTIIGVANIDAQTQALVTQLTELRTQQEVLKREGSAGPKFTGLRELEMRIEIKERQLRDSVGSLVATRRIELHRKHEDILDSLKLLDAQETRQNDLLAALPEKERRLIQLGRPILEAEAALAELMRWQKEAEISRASAISAVHLVDSARLPGHRKSPSLFRSGLTGVILALLAAVGLCFLLEYLDRSIKTPQQIEDGLGLPIYASIPAFSSVKRRDRGGSRRKPLVTLTAPRSVLAEGYRSLRANIRFADGHEPVKTLAITSSVQQEGKTITTLNLAIVLAQAGSRVVVVDADLRRPATHVHFGGEREPGLVEVMRGEMAWRDVVTATEVPNLDLIHAGRSPQNPGALLDSAEFRQFLAELKDEYEYVLFDVPPVLAVADAAAFFPKLDAVFLLVHYRRYGLEVAQGAQEQIERTGARLRGAVFNGFDIRRSSRGGYGYYGYYGYYSRYAADSA